MNAGLFSLFYDVAKSFHGIYRRDSVCHGDYGGKASGGGSGSTCVNVLFVELSRVAEMDVDVYQARGYNAA